MQQAKISVQDICCIALMAAVTVVMAQISIPMPMGVPMTMQTFTYYFELFVFRYLPVLAVESRIW